VSRWHFPSPVFAALLVAVVVVGVLLVGGVRSRQNSDNISTLEQAIARIDELRDHTCRQTNLLRQATREHLRATVSASEVFVLWSKSREVRAHFKTAIPGLRAQLKTMPPIDCVSQRSGS